MPEKLFQRTYLWLEMAYWLSSLIATAKHRIQIQFSEPMWDSLQLLLSPGTLCLRGHLHT